MFKAHECMPLLQMTQNTPFSLTEELGEAKAKRNTSYYFRCTFLLPDRCPTTTEQISTATRFQMAEWSTASFRNTKQIQTIETLGFHEL